VQNMSEVHSPEQVLSVQPKLILVMTLVIDALKAAADRIESDTPLPRT
jgi:hypothetical protein